MFIHQTRLPHVLAPRLYSSPDQYAREVEALFQPAWHCLGSTADLARPGDFITREWLGEPLIVRNFDGELQAFLNVCTHRHCLLRSERQGSSASFTCQYHGWEYDRGGCTKHIPDARSFKPLRGGPERLRKFRTATRGPLVFVSLCDDSPDIDGFLGPLGDPCQEFSAERWWRAASWESEFRCNWKIPVENTIESYHVPIVHPHTFFHYGAEEDTTHEIHTQGTVMRSPSILPRAYRTLANSVLPWLQADSMADRFRLFHVFPHLFLVRIDATLQVMTVVPVSPDTCRLAVQVFVLRAAQENLLTRLLTRFWGILKTQITRRILAEDAPLYPALQRGMQSSPFRGTISIREELIFAFQDYVRRQCELPARQTEQTPAPSDAPGPVCSHVPALEIAKLKYGEPDAEA